MGESEFWRAMTLRVHRELSSHAFQGGVVYWCDGLYPTYYWLDDDSPRIEGDAIIGCGTEFTTWRFTLHLPSRTNGPRHIDWEQLLPPVDAEQWIEVDLSKSRMALRPDSRPPQLL